MTADSPSLEGYEPERHEGEGYRWLKIDFAASPEEKLRLELYCMNGRRKIQVGQTVHWRKRAEELAAALKEARHGTNEPAPANGRVTTLPAFTRAQLDDDEKGIHTVDILPASISEDLVLLWEAAKADWDSGLATRATVEFAEEAGNWVRKQIATPTGRGEDE